jgi:hypothetical protein
MHKVPSQVKTIATFAVSPPKAVDAVGVVGDADAVEDPPEGDAVARITRLATTPRRPGRL